MEVEFDNHVGRFIFLDKDCIPYINMTTRELRRHERGNYNYNIYSLFLCVQFHSPTFK